MHHGLMESRCFRIRKPQFVLVLVDARMEKTSTAADPCNNGRYVHNVERAGLGNIVLDSSAFSRAEKP